MTVAFHFQFSNQAGWKCDACRKSGLEKKRRCGWLGFGAENGASPVWARQHVSTDTCPKSYITAESEVLVEDFLVRRCLRSIDVSELTAREVDAFVILERALAQEMNDGQHNTRHAF